MPLLEDGQTIRDVYEVERQLGEGAFAEVYRVRHRYLGRQALKLIKLPDLDAGQIDKIMGEAILLSRIEHPNIIRVFDAGNIEIEGHLHAYLTMEYVRGGTLDQFWRMYPSYFMTVPTAVSLITQVCRGLALAHGQEPPIIHRDIKPQNILIGYDAHGALAKLSDFGLARSVNPLTLLATAQGTQGFKAPETFQDIRCDSRAGDVWAVGVTLYLLLTNKMPFEQSNQTPFRSSLMLPSSLNPECDLGLDRIVAKTLAVEPSSRYTEATALLLELEQWSSGQDTRVFASQAGDGAQAESDSEATSNSGRQLAIEAVALAQSPAQLRQAAERMEQAFSQLPTLRSVYQARVELWRKGIAL